MRRLVVLALALLCVAAPQARAAELRLAPPVPGSILRHFEPPPTPYAAGHRGLDMAASAGSAVRAAEAGTVTFAGQVGGQLFLTISHGELRTSYSFLSALMVRAGDTVARDQVVARSGEGHAGSEVPHLHLGLRRGDEYLDPEPFLLDTLRKEPWRVLRLVEA